MTDEQIKQAADAYAELLTAGNKEHYRAIYIAAKEGYETGAHSRDEEVEELQEEFESLRKGFYERGDKLKKLMLENNKLRNPWISVEERLPEKWKRIKVQSGTGEACWAWVSKTVFVNAEGWDNDPEKAFYDFDAKIWWSEFGDNIENLFGTPEYWMPIPSLKGGAHET